MEINAWLMHYNQGVVVNVACEKNSNATNTEKVKP